MLYLSLTADYELFFGKNSYSEDETLIKPTRELLDIVKCHNASVTLMADILSVFRYREFKIEGYPEAFEKQLKYAVANGHDVQLHIHPHWLKSTYLNNCWTFDRTSFRIHNFGFDATMQEENSANRILFEGKRYLDNLLKPVKDTYSCTAFRAGGWCIQPEIEVFKALKSVGINIDSTVFNKGYMNTDTHKVDFRNVPSDSSYWVDPYIGINSACEYNIINNILEVCIGSYSLKPSLYLYKIINKLSKMLSKQNSQKGTFISSNNISMHKGLFNKLNRQLMNFINLPIILSLEGNSSYVLKEIIKYYIRKHKREDGYVTLITHPKCLDSNDFKILNSILNYINKNYKGEIKFLSLSDINNKLFI